MTKFIIRSKAKDDLLSIGRYTQRKWGIEQRNRYLKQIDDTFPVLAGEPTKGRKCDYIKKDYLKYRIGKHYIYFREIESGIEIIRILHERMDVDKHLD